MLTRRFWIFCLTLLGCAGGALAPASATVAKGTQLPAYEDSILAKNCTFERRAVVTDDGKIVRYQRTRECR